MFRGELLVSGRVYCLFLKNDCTLAKHHLLAIENSRLAEFYYRTKDDYITVITIPIPNLRRKKMSMFYAVHICQIILVSPHHQ